MRIRIKFAKKSAVQYLGHLDIMRFFQRSFNRADVKMEYSIGYNPHQKMSFAQPLGVGIISCGEYLDAEIAAGQDLEEIRRRLNEVCGDGFEVLSVKALPDDAKKAMAALRYARYRVDVRGLEAGDLLTRAINDLLAEKEILVTKTTKSGSREVDIRPQIVKLTCEDGVLSMTLTAASDNNLKPDTLTREIIQKTGIEYQREKVTIKREELYAEDFVPLEQFQTL